MPDFIPVSDVDFSVWLDGFSAAFTGSPAAVGLTPADATALSASISAFGTAFGENQTAQTAARTKRQAKDDARAATEALVRGLVRRIQAFPGTTDAMRTSLGITVRDSVASGPSPAALAVLRPWAKVDTSQRLRHTIDFRDAGTPDRRAKPAGVKGCEIWVKIGSAPTNPPADMQFLALDTATPYVVEYTLADANKVAYYMLRWINADGEKGPWSETVEATIVG